jgi:hypothetical protein
MDIVTATTDYERWLRSFVEPNQADLDYKYARMADRNDPFPFFRGTYYRWAQTWLTACPAEANVPQVLSVGDLHVENFGTWRDSDGRLCWGVNDFDEADILPYTNDLIRLATSLLLAKWTGAVDVKFGQACKAILNGYVENLEAGGVPYVLEEKNIELRQLAMAEDRNPTAFWKKLTKLLADDPAEPTDAARLALLSDLPEQGLKPAIRFRPRVGMGSLGKPRYVALVEWSGSWIAREVKATIPPGTAFASGQTARTSLVSEIHRRAVRCPDPYFRPAPYWTARRLSPRCSRIELNHFAHADEMKAILYASGGETANVHAGSTNAIDPILEDLRGRKKGWLEEAAKEAAQAVEKDWKQWRKHARSEV